MRNSWCRAVRAVAFAGVAIGSFIAAPASAQERSEPQDLVARGRYLVVVGGCNDCHTPGYPEAAGQLPEAQWLTGIPVGFQGPWGTTYPTNLRLSVQALAEDDWLRRVRSPLLPPMPWFNVAQMDENDVRAIYRFVKSLGAAGEPAPTYVGPGAVVTTPVIDFVPRLPGGTAP